MNIIKLTLVEKKHFVPTRLTLIKVMYQGWLNIRINT